MNSAILPVPAIGEVFELTLDPVPDPLEMLRFYGGFYSPTTSDRNWQYVVWPSAPQTGMFRLVKFSYEKNWENVLTTLGHPVIQGKWLEAFRRTFQQPDVDGPFGIPDASWRDPLGHSRFPCLDGERGSWHPYFHFADYSFFNDSWLWLIPA